MDNAMFCYQCEQTVGGKGCTKLGVCGKTPEISNLQESQKIKENLRSKASTNKDYPDQATYNLSKTKEEMLKDAVKAGIMYDGDLDADIRSLRQTIVYGLKGISAYGHQARFLGYYDDQVDNFYFLGLECTTNDNLSVEELIRMTMRTGDMSVAVMKKLDEANTESYKNPTPHLVNVKVEKGPFIIVSGHDLKDLEMLLKQTEGMGIYIPMVKCFLLMVILNLKNTLI